MKSEEYVHWTMEIIRKNVIGCPGCMARDIAMIYSDSRSSVAEEALLELLRQENADLQLVAYRALSCCEQIGEEAAKILTAFVKDGRNKPIILDAQEKFNISPII